MHDAANLSRATSIRTTGAPSRRFRHQRHGGSWSRFVALMLASGLLLCGLTAPQARAQATAPSPPVSPPSTPTELIDAGDRESAARRPALALPLYERALRADPANYAALWKACRELVDLGEIERVPATRTNYYARATDYARRAVAAQPNDAEGHFHLARAIGRTALSVGVRERVKYGIIVRDEALRALELAPRHPGALHVMGVWNAEIMRLSGIARVVAKTFLGGKIFETASWAEATRFMELSASVEPDRLVHRLDLARVYRDTGRTAEARAAYQAAIAGLLLDANDDMYKRDATRELAALK